MRQFSHRVNSRPRSFISHEAGRSIEWHENAAARENAAAIEVNGREIWYFSKQPTTNICTCRQHVTIDNKRDIGDYAVEDARTNKPNASHEVPVPIRITDDESFLISVDVNQPVFGYYPDAKAIDNTVTVMSPHEQVRYDQPKAATELDLAVVQTEEVQRRNFGAGSRCAVCCRTGYSGGYKLFGHDRRVLDYFALSALHGYQEDRATYPYSWYSLSLEGGYVEWTLDVPTYFFDVYYGVYNNTELLMDYDWEINGEPCTLDTVRNYAGTRVTIRVYRVARLTHCVFIFRLTDKALKADLPVDANPVDYSKFIAKPPSQGHVSNAIQTPLDGDFVFRIHDGAFWKVSEFTTYGMANDRALGYTLTLDYVQPEHADYHSLHQLQQL